MEVVNYKERHTRGKDLIEAEIVLGALLLLLPPPPPSCRCWGLGWHRGRGTCSAALAAAAEECQGSVMCWGRRPPVHCPGGCLAVACREGAAEGDHHRAGGQRREAAGHGFAGGDRSVPGAPRLPQPHSQGVRGGHTQPATCVLFSTCVQEGRKRAGCAHACMLRCAQVREGWRKDTQQLERLGY